MVLSEGLIDRSDRPIHYVQVHYILCQLLLRYVNCPLAVCRGTIESDTWTRSTTTDSQKNTRFRNQRDSMEFNQVPILFLWLTTIEKFTDWIIFLSRITTTTSIMYFRISERQLVWHEKIVLSASAFSVNRKLFVFFKNNSFTVDCTLDDHYQF